MAETKRYVAHDGILFDVSDLELWELDSEVELSGEEDVIEIERLQQAIKIGYLVNN